MKVLELFSGTASFSNVAKERGHIVFTVDNDKRFNPDLCKDVMDLNKNDIPFIPDVIWASPPCTCFSVASIHWNWIKNKDGSVKPKTERTKRNIEFVRKTQEILNWWFPESIWFIENPRAMLRKMPFMERYEKRNTVTYCKYGLSYMKPTDIWTNSKEWKPREKCSNNSPCHQRAPRGSGYGVQGIGKFIHPPVMALEKMNRGWISSAAERGIVPKELCEEIIIACEKELGITHNNNYENKEVR